MEFFQEQAAANCGRLRSLFRQRGCERDQVGVQVKAFGATCQPRVAGAGQNQAATQQACQASPTHDRRQGDVDLPTDRPDQLRHIFSRRTVFYFSEQKAGGRAGRGTKLWRIQTKPLRCLRGPALRAAIVFNLVRNLVRNSVRNLAGTADQVKDIKQTLDIRIIRAEC